MRTNYKVDLSVPLCLLFLLFRCCFIVELSSLSPSFLMRAYPVTTLSMLLTIESVTVMSCYDNYRQADSEDCYSQLIVYFLFISFGYVSRLILGIYRFDTVFKLELNFLLVICLSFLVIHGGKKQIISHFSFTVIFVFIYTSFKQYYTHKLHNFSSNNNHLYSRDFQQTSFFLYINPISYYKVK